MQNNRIKHFTEIDITAVDEFYDIEFEVNGAEITLDLNFDSTQISAVMADRINMFIDKLPLTDNKNKQFIQSDFTDGTSVKEYLGFHLDLVNAPEIQELIAHENKTLSPIKQLLSVLHLKRVGLYPEETDYIAIFDYTIGEDVTDDLLVISVKENGNVDHITIES